MLATAAGCGGSTTTGGGGGGDDTVNITVLADRTGKAAFFGEAIATSVDFTEGYINDNGGIDGKPIAIDVQDTDL